MAITTYTELGLAVANWLGRADLTSYVPDLIALGEKRIMRKLRCREMEAALSGTISSGVLAVPADYLELKHAYINSSIAYQLQRASASQIYSRYPVRQAEGFPKFIARDGDNFIFGPYPAGDYSVVGIYYADPGLVSASNHAVFTAYPDLYLFAALAEAAPFLKDDPRVTLWETKFASILADANSLDATEYNSGGGMQVVAA